MNAQNHDEKTDSDDDEERESKPTQHHSTGADSTPDTPVAEILRHLRARHGRRVLPQDRDEHEDGRDEDQRQSHLRDGPRGEGLDVDVGAGAGVALFVPAGEGGEEEECDESEDDGHDAVGGCLSAGVFLKIGH